MSTVFTFSRWLLALIVIPWPTALCKRQLWRLPPGALPGPVLLEERDPQPFYEGDSVAEFLQLCPKGCDDFRACDVLPLLIEQTDCSPEHEEYVENLKIAQTCLRDFQVKYGRFSTHVGITYSFITLCVILCLILIVRKHFSWKAMFDSRVLDPCDGVPLWQFKSMKFATFKIEDTRPYLVRLEEYEKVKVKMAREREILENFKLRLAEEAKTK